MSAAPGLELDHVVIAAATLDAGADWCRRTLGAAPVAGGRHPFMGTHNRLLDIASPRFPRAYLEIIAVDPEASAPAVPRWFGLDEPALQRSIGVEPRLVHWVARCADIAETAARLRGLGFDPGAVVEAERETSAGLLRWRITLRADGRTPGDGAVPALIQWRDAHPSDRLQASGVGALALALGRAAAPLSPELGGDAAIRVDPGLGPSLQLDLLTPRGPVRLRSPDETGG